jgi:hypothetical protein
MKRRTLLVAFFAAGLALCAEDAVLLETRGTVEVQGRSGDSWIDVDAGTELYADDVVRTGKDGAATILFSDGTRYDMFSGSILTITVAERERLPFFKRVWRAVTSKFSDTRYTSAYVGGVGTLRGEGKEGELIYDEELGEQTAEELASLLSQIDESDYPVTERGLFRGIVFEDYGQYRRAEAEYLSYQREYPDKTLPYELLLELYIKLDFYSHAQELLDARPQGDARR